MAMTLTCVGLGARDAAAAGQRQAALVSRRLAGRSPRRPTRVVSSDLSRAVETAHAIAGELGVRGVETDERLREMHLGMFQGMTAAEARERHREAWDRYRADESFAIPGGGESLEGFTRRCADALTDIARRNVGEVVCVVTHGGVIDAARRALTPGAGGGGKCGNTGVCEFVWSPLGHGDADVDADADADADVDGDADDGAFELLLWNCTRHLHEHGAGTGGGGADDVLSR